MIYTFLLVTFYSNLIEWLVYIFIGSLIKISKIIITYNIQSSCQYQVPIWKLKYHIEILIILLSPFKFRKVKILSTTHLLSPFIIKAILDISKEY